MSGIQATISLGDLVTCRYGEGGPKAKGTGKFRRGRVVKPEQDWAVARMVPGSNCVVDTKDGDDQMVMVQLTQDGNKMYKSDEGPVRWFKQKDMLAK